MSAMEAETPEQRRIRKEEKRKRKEAKQAKKRARDEGQDTNGATQDDNPREASPAKKARIESDLAEPAARDLTERIANGVTNTNGTSHARSNPKLSNSASTRPSTRVAASSSRTAPESLPTSSPSSSPSPFHEIIASFYLPIAPIATIDPTSALCSEHISPLLLTYYPPLHGILLSYKDVQVTSSRPKYIDASQEGAGGDEDDEGVSSERHEPLAIVQKEYAVSYIWLTATFTLFTPSVPPPPVSQNTRLQRGRRRPLHTPQPLKLTGQISLQTESHISLLLWNYFTCSIPHTNMPPKWSFNSSVEDPNAPRWDTGDDTGVGDEGGYWVNESGGKVETGSLLDFWVSDWEAREAQIEGGMGEGDRGFLSVEGTLVEPN